MLLWRTATRSIFKMKNVSSLRRQTDSKLLKSLQDKQGQRKGGEKNKDSRKIKAEMLSVAVTE